MSRFYSEEKGKEKEKKKGLFYSLRLSLFQTENLVGLMCQDIETLPFSNAVWLLIEDYSSSCLKKM